MMPSRRSFLKICSGVVSFAGASQSLIAGRTSPAGRLSIGAQTNTYGVPIKGYDHLLSVLDALAGLGYQGFETNERSLAPYAERAGEMRKAFEAHHVPLIAPHCGGRIGLLTKDEIEPELERLHQIAGWAAQMGAKHLIFSGAKLGEQDGKLDVEQVHQRMESLNRLGQTCKQEGLQLCYHNEVQDFQDNPSEMSYLLGETDPELVRLCFDVGNGYKHGEDPGPFSADHYRRIAMYHLKDVKQNEAGKSVPVDLGTGAIDLRAVVAPVLKSDWRGWITVERESNYPLAADNPEQLLKQCRGYVREIVGV